MKGHANLIEQLGGGTAIAAAIWGEGATTKQRNAVYKWRLNGVPWRYRQVVASLARRRRLAVPADFLVPSHDGLGSTDGRSSLQAAE